MDRYHKYLAKVLADHLYTREYNFILLLQSTNNYIKLPQKGTETLIREMLDDLD